MQEQVNEKTVALSVKAAKLTGRLLAKAMRAFLKKAGEPSVAHGKQSVKSLAKQGASLSNIEISGDNIGSFSRIARKYNVDFALKRDDAEMPPKWLVFFKAKDADALTAAFNEYSKIQLKHKGRKPSLLARLEKAKELATQIASPVKNRSKGGHEL
ncbi:MAG: PcfB family protein [Oscillospiraceae bacterium]|nr:PcfB family protein [Oscillospiraceae bacterium]